MGRRRTEKGCPSCGLIIPVDENTKNYFCPKKTRKRKDGTYCMGYAAYCRPCASKKKKAWKNANPEKYKAIKKKMAGKYYRRALAIASSGEPYDPNDYPSRIRNILKFLFTDEHKLAYERRKQAGRKRRTKEQKRKRNIQQRELRLQKKCVADHLIEGRPFKNTKYIREGEILALDLVRARAEEIRNGWDEKTRIMRAKVPKEA